MATIRTHYDNLQVAENASPEVIRGAYRYLVQKWHPDKNPNDLKRAERIASMIIEAYAVLSDPERRQAHDRWIASERAAETQARPSTLVSEPVDPSITRVSTPRVGVLTRTWLMVLFVTSLAFLVVVFPYRMWAGEFKWSYLAALAFWAATAHYAYTKLFQKVE